MSLSLDRPRLGRFSVRRRTRGVSAASSLLVRGPALVLAGWMLALSFPPLLLDLEHDPALGIRYQIAAFSLAIPLLTVVNSRAVTQIIPLWYASPKILLLTGALLLAIVNSIAISEANIIFYVAAFAVVFTVLGALWFNDEESQQRVALYSSICLFGFIAYAFLTQPLDLDRRHVGFIHPNLLGATAMSAAILYCLSAARLKAVAMAVAAAVMVIVSSRSSLVAFAVFVGILGGYYSISSRKAFLWCLAGLAIGSIAFFRYREYIASFLDRALILDDVDRGLASGLSGRAEAWEGFLPQLSENAFLGVGFRQRDAYEGTHNAILNLFVENGVIGGSLLFGFMFIVIITSARIAFARKSSSKRSREIAAIVLAALCAFVVRGLAEPQILNIGDAPSLTLLFVLAFVCIGERRVVARPLLEPSVSPPAS